MDTNYIREGVSIHCAKETAGHGNFIRWFNAQSCEYELRTAQRRKKAASEFLASPHGAPFAALRLDELCALAASDKLTPGPLTRAIRSYTGEPDTQQILRMVEAFIKQ